MSEPTPPNIWPDTSSSTLGSDGTALSHIDNVSVSTLGGSTAMPTNVSPRRPSVQFNVETSTAQLSKKRTDGPRRTLSNRSIGRIPSPPPPSAYNRGVSFDTFDNRDATDFSLTLNYKHRDYHPTRRSRTFLCGTDQNDYSDFALEWLIDELVDDGDEIVCLRVVEKDSKIASDASLEERRYRQEAQKLLDQVIAKNSQDEKAISLVLEYAVGKVQEIIQRMIQIYEPAVLIVGTRGRSLGGMQGLLPGSVSKYCLQQSPIPVIVVRPSTKREKKKQKRLANPTRQRYNHVLRLNDMKSGRLFDKSRSTDSIVTKLLEEEAAVAQAVGLHDLGGSAGAHTSRDPRLSFSRDTASTKSTDDNDYDMNGNRRSSSVANSESTAPDFSSALKNQRIESPAITDDEDDEDERDTGDDDDDSESGERAHVSSAPDGRRQRSSEDATTTSASPKKPPLVPITNVTVTEYTPNVDEPH